MDNSVFKLLAKIPQTSNHENLQINLFHRVLLRSVSIACRSLPGAVRGLRGFRTLFPDARGPNYHCQSDWSNFWTYGKKDAKSANQLNRWVAAKEDHASKIQKIIAEYFLTQRIKPSSEKYGALLKGAHSVMVAAMKCKQGADTQTADTLKSAIKSFQQVYEK